MVLTVARLAEPRHCSFALLTAPGQELLLCVFLRIASMALRRRDSYFVRFKPGGYLITRAWQEHDSYNVYFKRYSEAAFMLLPRYLHVLTPSYLYSGRSDVLLKCGYLQRLPQLSRLKFSQVTPNRVCCNALLAAYARAKPPQWEKVRIPCASSKIESPTL